MGRRRRPTKLGWRWRRNPLRRRSDVVEAWLGLVTAVLFCAVPVIGWWAGHSADRTLQRVVRAQRAERTLVAATVAGDPAGKPKRAGGAVGTVAGAVDVRRGDVLRWTAPDRSVHTASVPVDLEVWHKDKVLLWTGPSGALVPPPLDSATATTHSVLAGSAVGAAAGGLLLISRKVLMWRLMRRRLASWEREWVRVSQDWGRAGAGG